MISPAPRIDPARELVNHRFRHVADDGEAAGHVAVNRAIADREFALVSGGEEDVAELVRERHQDHSAQARLHVFFRRVLGQTGEDFLELRLESGEGVRDRDLQTSDAEIARESERIVDAAARGIGARHGDADDVLRA